MHQAIHCLIAIGAARWWRRAAATAVDGGSGAGGSTSHYPETWGEATDAVDLILARMFALTVSCELLAGQAIVFRQLELYGVLLDVAVELQETEPRKAFMFDARSEARVQEFAVSARERCGVCRYIYI